MSKAHPGFKAVQSSIAKKQGVSKERAGAILGAKTRAASAAAKKANPNLKKVKGSMHGGGVIPESGKYEMEQGELVVPASVNAGMREHGVQPMPKVDVKAYPASGPAEAMGPGHWEVDGDDAKFVKE